MALRITVLASGSITCPPDWDVSVSGCQYHRLYCKRGGTAFCTLPETTLTLENDTLYLFPAFSPYHLTQDRSDPFDVLWFHIVSLPVLTRGLVIVPLEGNPVLRASIALLEALVPYGWQDVDGCKDPLLESALELLFELIGRKTRLQPCNDTRIAATLVRLLEADGGWVSIQTLAGIAGMESHYFSRRFHQETGLSVKAYQVHLRMQNAMNLLRRDLLVAEVASSLGYEDEKAFSRAFRNAVGTTPTDYRKRYLLQL